MESSLQAAVRRLKAVLQRAVNNMIIDVHSHAWQYPTHFNDDFQVQARRARAGVEVDLTVRLQRIPRRSHACGLHNCLRRQGSAQRIVGRRRVCCRLRRGGMHERLIGFLSVDPTQDNWERELHQGHKELGLRGIKLLPMYAGFRPDDERLDPLWEYATEHALPRSCSTPAATFIAQCPGLNARCRRHLDRVATPVPRSQNHRRPPRDIPLRA